MAHEKNADPYGGRRLEQKPITIHHSRGLRNFGAYGRCERGAGAGEGGPELIDGASGQLAAEAPEL